VSQRDPRGYYAALGLSPGANEIEIGMAFRARKRAYLERRISLDIKKVQAAYEILRNPAKRKAYDEGQVEAGASPLRARLPSMSELATGRRLWIAAASVLLLGAVLVWAQHGATVRGTFVRFETGDALVDIHTGAALGEVTRVEGDHVFPNGGKTRAYQVDLETGGSKWFPAKDLERNYSRR
jgi:hypothetical protein